MSMNENISFWKKTDNMVFLKRETHQWLARTWWIGARKLGRLHILENMVLSICLPWVVTVGEELPAFYFSVSPQNSIKTWKKELNKRKYATNTTIVSHEKVWNCRSPWEHCCWRQLFLSLSVQFLLWWR